MKKTCILLLTLLCLSWAVQSQTPSAFTVNFMITYEENTRFYTAWVVPQYGTPNSNNPETNELGATAQFTLKIPTDFVLEEIQDIRGVWEKRPTKLVAGGGQVAYLVIGKSPTEANYGVFKKGEPVAVFRFRGTGGTPQQVTPLAKEDPFVHFANKTLSLNVSNSFYSRSGQSYMIPPRPAEQFKGATVLAEVMKGLQNNILLGTNPVRVTTDPGVVVYPNPTQDEVFVSFFSQQAGGQVFFELINEQGVAVRVRKTLTTLGLNTQRFTINDLPGGMYVMKANLPNQTSTAKVNKL